jgi:paraquat-inducible protein A
VGRWTGAARGDRCGRRRRVAVSATMRSAADAGLLSCGTCGLLARPAAAERPGYCPRCGATLAWRRRSSIQYTWALVIAAAICYVPANVLPVLTTTALGETESDTIMGGVIFLYATGSWPLALIVLIASVMIPLGKLVALAYLLVTVQRGSIRNMHDRTRIYELVEFVGRWSMLDVFVDAFIVALIQLQPLMSVEPGLGVVFFMAVVVLTMMAAQSFDPRLIWDAVGKRPVPHG